MIRFIIKGLLRDSHRSILPIIVVSLGVMLTVLMNAWITGVMGDSIEFSAKFSSGHVKIMTRSYAENTAQNPIDLSLSNASELEASLNTEYPDLTWVERITFGGLIDSPDENGETKAQGPALGMGIDLLSENSEEIDRLNIRNSLKRGNFPQNPGEVLISEQFSQKLGVNPGDEITLISSTMYGSMAIANFKVSGTVAFGFAAMDRGAVIADIEDIRLALDMYDATGEILGFFNEGYFDRELADALVMDFNEKYSDPNDEFSPQMVSLTDQGSLSMMVSYAENMTGIIAFIFILVMSIVLWNAGLLSGLRRYGEVGLRLAIGEEKGHIYRSLISESVVIGIIGSTTGTMLGLFFAYILQTKGLDISGMMDDAKIMMPTIMRARITTETYYLGFIPGLFSTVLGTMLSGIGIYKRQTAQLFKELET
ncbi:MAG: ABC transporter permease [Bacteroidales bacterium]|nr:ABC transporter permease [Bacteroidales bacterium]MCF8389914.1 ABC transporter permease [Bacteroidales bacterium]